MKNLNKNSISTGRVSLPHRDNRDSRDNRYALHVTRNNHLIIILLLCFSALLLLQGCKKDESKDDNNASGNSKLSPPSWLLGKWENDENETFEFKSNDVLFDGMSISKLAGITSVSELKKTADTYILTSQGGSEKGTCYYKFKKGDGTYIEAGTEIGKEPTELFIFEKIGNGGGGGGGNSGNIDPELIGGWVFGTATGGWYDPVTGKYLGVTGSGAVYSFKEDGTYFCLTVSTGTIINMYNQDKGNYSVNNGCIEFTNCVIERSNDGGNTFNAPENINDYQWYYVIDNVGDIIKSSTYPNPWNDPNKAVGKRGW